MRPTALLALTVLTAGTVVTAVVAPADAATAPGGLLRGRAAVDALGARLPAVAAVNGRTPAQLSDLLLHDDTARLGAGDRLLFVDAPVPARGAATTAAAPYPYAQTFALHSRPGAHHVIYLDFDGYTDPGSAWGMTGPHIGLDQDGDPTTFTTAEQDLVQAVWQQVAEDYSPTTVDVTTEDPGAAALSKDDGDDLYGQRAVITSDTAAWAGAPCNGTCGGISYVGIYGAPYYSPSWVFAVPGGVQDDNAKYIAEAVSHEVGHSLGLSHDGTTSGADYYTGQGIWAPIMGVGYYEPLTQFSRGEYAGANNQEDDFAVMAAHGAPLMPTGTSTTFTSSPGSAPGVVAGSGTANSYTFTTTCADQVTAHLGVAPVGPDLDAALVLRDATGAVLARADPAPGYGNGVTAAGLGADLASPVLAPGTYTLSVQGVGSGDPLATGYSSYGSRGTYGVTVGFCTGGAASAPSAPTSPTMSLDPVAVPYRATQRWGAPASSGGSPVVSYALTAKGDDGTLLTATVPAGTTSKAWSPLKAGVHYTFSVRATNSVGSGPAATVALYFQGTPQPPRIGTAVAGTAGAPVTAKAVWLPPTNTGGLPITGYVVYAANAATGRTVSAAVGASARSLVMKLPAGQYSFRVVARNSHSGSALSAASNTVTAR